MTEAPPDGDYDAFVIDVVDDDEGQQRLDLTIVAGKLKGQVVSVSTDEPVGDVAELLGMPATLHVRGGAPSVTIDDLTVESGAPTASGRRQAGAAGGHRDPSGGGLLQEGPGRAGGRDRSGASNSDRRPPPRSNGVRPRPGRRWRCLALLAATLERAATFAHRGRARRPRLVRSAS